MKINMKVKLHQVRRPDGTVVEGVLYTEPREAILAAGERDDLHGTSYWGLLDRGYYVEELEFHSVPLSEVP